MKSNPVAARLLIAAIVSWLAACGGGSGSSAEPPPPSTDGRAQALAVSRPGELAAYVQQRLRARPAGAASDGQMFSALPPTLAAVPVAGVADSAPPTRSGTLVQEAGVDEADLLQSDGTHLYTLQPQGQNLQLQVHQRAADGSLSQLRSLALAQPGGGEASTDGMHLNADGSALTIISQTWGAWSPVQCVTAPCLPAPGDTWSGGSVGVQRVDTRIPGTAVAGLRLDIQGLLVDSRRLGDTLVLVTSHAPLLAADALPLSATQAQRDAAIAAVKASDLLPTYRVNNGSPLPLLQETDCYVQPANKSVALDITVITVIDLKAADMPRTSRCFAGGTQALYMSRDNLYLATTRFGFLPFWRTAAIFATDTETDVHKFAFAAGNVQYRGSATVKGHLGWDMEKSSLRLSEHNGDLRVLTYTSEIGWASLDDAARVAPSPALLTVLREDAASQSLQAVGALPNANRPALLGKPGEQVYGVRFVGDRGYLVTFRRTDPLYVLDLANPTDPRIAGALELPGYSDYLFPLANGLLMGVGHDADANGMLTGVKMTLLDVADAAQPRVLDSTTLGHAGSVSALDFSRHGLNLLVKDGVARVALPVNLAPATGPGGDPWQRGLQRFEVDTSARTLRTLSMVGSAASTNVSPTWLERSLQIGDHVYYLGGGELTAHAW